MGGGCCDTLPHPAPQRRRRKTLAAGETLGHKDLVPASDPSFSLRDPGARAAFPERTDKRTVRPTDRRWGLDILKTRVISSAGMSPVSCSLHRPFPWQRAGRTSGETRGKLRPQRAPHPGSPAFHGDPAGSHGRGQGDSLLPGSLCVAPLALRAMGQGTGGGWLRIQNPELEFSLGPGTLEARVLGAGE